MARPGEVGLSLPRRRVLARLGVLLPCLALTRCASEDHAPRELRVALAEIPREGRARHLLGSVPVELYREGGEIIARSLLCTHQGCEVSWMPDEGRYRCPCHEALFNDEGVPIEGPANEALRRLAVVERHDHVIVRFLP